MKKRYEPGEAIIVKGEYFSDDPSFEGVDIRCIVLDFEFVEGYRYMWVHSFLFNTAILIPA